jgi:hypothetical protein
MAGPVHHLLHHLEGFGLGGYGMGLRVWGLGCMAQGLPFSTARYTTRFTTCLALALPRFRLNPLMLVTVEGSGARVHEEVGSGGSGFSRKLVQEEVGSGGSGFMRKWVQEEVGSGGSGFSSKWVQEKVGSAPRGGSGGPRGPGRTAPPPSPE